MPWRGVCRRVVDPIERQPPQRPGLRSLDMPLFITAAAAAEFLRKDCPGDAESHRPATTAVGNLDLQPAADGSKAVVPSAYGNDNNAVLDAERDSGRRDAALLYSQLRRHTA